VLEPTQVVNALSVSESSPKLGLNHEALHAISVDANNIRHCLIVTDNLVTKKESSSGSSTPVVLAVSIKARRAVGVD
jgi:hypothetical protein